MSECGTCTLCCKLMYIPELDKPAGEWCKHVDPQKGCKIYEDRPNVCRGFECVWLQAQKRERDNMMKTADLRPNKCKAVIVSSDENDSLTIKMDPVHPNAYKKGVLARLIESTPKLPWIVQIAGTSTAKAINESGQQLCIEQGLVPKSIEADDVWTEDEAPKKRE